MKVDNKNFYFDLGQNNRGIYMRVSEVSYYYPLKIFKNILTVGNFYLFLFLQVKSNFRTAITIPEKCWSRFRDILNDYCDKMKKPTSTISTTAANAMSPQSSSSGTPLGDSCPGGLPPGLLLGPIGAAASCSPSGGGSGVGLVGGLGGLAAIGSGGVGGMDGTGLSTSSNGANGGGGHK